MSNLQERKPTSSEKSIHSVIREMGIEIEETKALIDKLNTKLEHSIANKRRLEIAVDDLLDEENY